MMEPLETKFNFQKVRSMNKATKAILYIKLFQLQYKLYGMILQVSVMESL